MRYSVKLLFNSHLYVYTHLSNTNACITNYWVEKTMLMGDLIEYHKERMSRDGWWIYDA